MQSGKVKRSKKAEAPPASSSEAVGLAGVESDAESMIARIYSVLFSLFIFLMPLKFGSITGVPEIPFLPYDLISWIIFTYPPILFPIAASIFAISAFFLFKRPQKFSFNVLLSILCSIMALISILGAFRASVKDFPILQICHFSGIALCVAAFVRSSESCPKMKIYAARAILLSTLFLLASGVQQYFWGFRESLDYVYGQELKTGAALPSGVMGRLQQTRIFATFSLCNSFAAHLILTIPFCIYLVFTDLVSLKLAIIFIISALVYFIFPDCPQFLFILISMAYSASVVLTIARFPLKFADKFSFAAAILLAGLFLFNLHLSGSRAAVLSFGAATALIVPALVFAKFANLRKAIVLCVVLVFCVIPIYVMTNAGRDLGSMKVRLDYYSVASRIFAENPLIGTGWGDFFHEYPKLKQFPGTEAPHTPHNFVLSFASQCGIAGLLATLALFFALPISAYLASLRSEPAKRYFDSALMLGFIAWALHSLLDINIQISGSVATALVMLCIPNFEMPALKKLDVIGILSRPAVKFIFFQTGLLLVFFALGLSIYRLRGEYAFLALHDICEARFASEDDVKKVPISLVESKLKAAVSQMPYSPFPWAVAGAFFQRRGLWELSESCYANAAELSPERASYFYRLALNQIRQGKKTQAIENLEKAAEMFPNAEYGDLLDKIKHDNMKKEAAPL